MLCCAVTPGETRLPPREMVCPAQLPLSILGTPAASRIGAALCAVRGESRDSNVFRYFLNGQ